MADVLAPLVFRDVRGLRHAHRGWGPAILGGLWPRAVYGIVGGSLAIDLGIPALRPLAYLLCLFVLVFHFAPAGGLGVGLRQVYRYWLRTGNHFARAAWWLVRLAWGALRWSGTFLWRGHTAFWDVRPQYSPFASGTGLGDRAGGDPPLDDMAAQPLLAQVVGHGNYFVWRRSSRLRMICLSCVFLCGGVFIPPFLLIGLCFVVIALAIQTYDVERFEVAPSIHYGGVAAGLGTAADLRDARFRSNTLQYTTASISRVTMYIPKAFGYRKRAVWADLHAAASCCADLLAKSNPIVDTEIAHSVRLYRYSNVPAAMLPEITIGTCQLTRAMYYSILQHGIRMRPCGLGFGCFPTEPMGFSVAGCFPK